MGKVSRLGQARVKEICELPLNALDVDMKAELVKALIPIGLWHVEEVLPVNMDELILLFDRIKEQKAKGVLQKP